MRIRSEPPVARKKAPPAPPKPSTDRVQQAISRGDLHGAYLAAKLLYANEPTPPHLAMLKSTLSSAALLLESGGKTSEFNKLMQDADQIDAANPEWSLERACLLARGGRLADALMRVDESSRLRVLGHGVDRALKVGSKEFLPDELHAGFDAVVAAFAAYEAGNDEAARAALEPIGLRSPFLEWKVLLRGLTAFAARDDARAAENFARLDRTRIPFRLCGPYFAAADPAYKASLPGPVAAELAKRFACLNTGTIDSSFREMAQHLGREKPLTPVFTLAETLLPRLRKEAPALAGKLAKCLYHAIIRQGQPDDLARYRKLFGPLADDPQFFRLQARIAEEIGQIAVSNKNWLKYEEWLGTKPAGWPEPLLSRVRAMIWHHMAMDSPEEDAPPTLACLRRTFELAPDWSDGAAALYRELRTQGSEEEAERVARAILAIQPENVVFLEMLAIQVSQQNRPDESLALYRKVLAADPLNDQLSIRTAYSVLAVARSRLCGKKPAEAEQVLNEHSEILSKHIPTFRDALLAVMAKKLGDEVRAERLLSGHSGMPNLVLAIPFAVSVDSQLAKLKPAVRKGMEKSFADAMAGNPTPLQVNMLLFVYDMYLEHGLTYRGQKGQLKKFVALASKVFEARSPEADYEVLGDHLFRRREFKVARQYAASGIAHFPQNPYFRLLYAEAADELAEAEGRIRLQAQEARRLAEASREPRHKALLPRIDALLRSLPDEFAFLDSFFKGRF